MVTPSRDSKVSVIQDKTVTAFIGPSWLWQIDFSALSSIRHERIPIRYLHWVKGDHLIEWRKTLYDSALIRDNCAPRFGVLGLPKARPVPEIDLDKRCLWARIHGLAPQ